MGFPRLQRMVVRGMSACALVAGFAGLGQATGTRLATLSATVPQPALAQSGCLLASNTNNIRHVIYIQFDNVHFTRDNPNVPSDLEQMPHLLNFIEQNGTIMSKHYTPLIAHTATDILTSITGLYGDRMGMPVSNSYRFFNPNGTSSSAGSFAYWTAPVSASNPTDSNYTMVTSGGANTPAPWVPYTRAGCNFGSVSMANTALENTGVDIPAVFGAGSAQAQEVHSNPDQGYADFVGVAIHCALGNSVCSSANGAQPDKLPSEPGGYSGYMGLFGHKYVAPAISPNQLPMTDLNGQVITNADSGDIGFPGFDPTAAQSLAYVADMQEHNVPVTYAYIADAHDNHAPNGNAFGPGEAGYVAQLKSYDQAFATFFQRLANDGINQSNTLFVVTADENDHFAGGQPTNPGCDGVNVPCTYNKIGEVAGNLTGLLASQQGVTTPFAVHADSAPNFYITGNPSQSSAITRNLERSVGNLTATNPYTGNTEHITNFLADQTEMNLLHMVSADPARTPTFTMFAKPDYFLSTGAPNCNSPCISINPAFAWNHGDISPDINTTWLGLVGPGVRNLGVDSTTWSDHTDIRPTMLELLGLKDDYQSDGRVLFEGLNPSSISPSLRAHQATLLALAQEYKRINAPVGAFGIASLQAATAALESGGPSDPNNTNDQLFTSTESKLQSLTAERNAVATHMAAILNDAEFNGQAINEQQAKGLIAQGEQVFHQMDMLAVSLM